MIIDCASILIGLLLLCLSELASMSVEKLANVSFDILVDTSADASHNLDIFFWTNFNSNCTQQETNF